MNLPDLVHQYLDDHATTSVSEVLAQPEPKVRAAFAAAVPVILEMIEERCGEPEDADVIFAAVTGCSPVELDLLPEQLSPTHIQTSIATGNRRLAALFGRASSEELRHALSRFADIGQSAASSIAGISMWLALAVLARHGKAGTSHELALYLHSQREEIKAALPAGFYEYLDEAPKLRNLSHHFDDGSSSTATDDAMQDEAGLHRQENRHNDLMYRADRNENLSSGLVWFVPVLILLAIGAAIIFSIYPRNANEPQSVTVIPASPEAMPAGSRMEAVPEPLDLPSEPRLGEALPRLLRELSTELSRNPADLEKLQSIRSELSQLSPRVGRLPAAQQRLVTERLNNALPALDASARTERPAQVREVVNSILQQIRSMAQQPG